VLLEIPNREVDRGPLHTQDVSDQPRGVASGRGELDPAGVLAELVHGLAVGLGEVLVGEREGEVDFAELPAVRGDLDEAMAAELDLVTAKRAKALAPRRARLT
jgi:hypothetical protein